MPTPGSIRGIEFGTCAAIACELDAQYEVYLTGNDDSALWVPVCPGHLASGPVDGLEYVIEVHGFIGAGAGTT
jgi:hypothetical protein